MSAIDQYRHKVIGKIECPSDYDLVFGSPNKTLPIYQLEQDVPVEETSFDGKAGDILVGGGSGEAEALRIAHPKAMCFFKVDDWDDFERYEDLFKDFWSPSFAYKVGVGFRKLGWDPETPLEQWLAEKVINMLLENREITLNEVKGRGHP